jgi:hypothetical protein
VTAQGVTDWTARAQRLADLLVARGDVHDPAWWAAVPRHVFVPAAYQQEGTGAWQPVDVTSPSGLDLVYSPTTFVTAVVDRRTHQEAVSAAR